MQNNSKSFSLFSIYFLGFLFSLNVALTAYIDSSFLKNFISGELVGSIFTVTYIFVILGYFLMPFVLRKYGNFKISIFLIIIELLTLTGLAVFSPSFWLVFLVMLNLISSYLIYLSIDIFLENYSDNRQTGVLRGIYLTGINLAWVLSQVISGTLLIDNNYQNVYFTSSMVLAPVFFILLFGLRNFKDSNYEVPAVWQTIKTVWANKNIFNIFMSNFLLYFFYAWMIIYMPLYLNENLGYSWLEIGKIFFVMLLPFVFIQYPLGYLADKKWGEKEILSVGFILMAITTGIISFISDGNLILWAVILFLTRIGAGMVEVMCSAYFFKKVDSFNVNIISFFRMSGPLAFIFGSLFATILLNSFSFDIKYLFLILGLLMFLGLKFSLSLQDTR